MGFAFEMSGHNKIIPVILSGGQGTRLWPLSRSAMPKQFIPLLFGKSLFEATLSRVRNRTIFTDPIIICSKDHRFLVRKILGERPAEKIIAEPFGRNTAPALAIASLYAQQAEGDPLLLVLPSDHYIPDDAEFLATVNQAVPFAKDGRIVTFGIHPTAPHTGFGYIEKSTAGFDVVQFHEKPNQATAETYIANENFYWNAGIFLVRASVYEQLLAKYSPAVLNAAERTLSCSKDDLGDLILNSQCFADAPDVSIDIAVMEKTDRASIVPATFRWDDLGSWDSLWKISDKDTAGNAEYGDTLAVKTKNSYLRTDGPFLCTVGVDNIIAVADQGTVFVGSREYSEQIKDLIAKLKNDSRPELAQGNFVYRPWGYYEVLIESENFKVKRIGVRPGQRLSLQSHIYRSEHWVVVRGVAHITIGDKNLDLQHDQSTYIPAGAVHRLENKTDTDLEIIEVQTGSYLGEDDIVRYEDDYSRIEV